MRRLWCRWFGHREIAKDVATGERFCGRCRAWRRVVSPPGASS